MDQEANLKFSGETWGLRRNPVWYSRGIYSTQFAAPGKGRKNQPKKQGIKYSLSERRKKGKDGKKEDKNMEKKGKKCQMRKHDGKRGKI